MKLVPVLILFVAVCSATPQAKHVTDSEKTCLANRQTIANAVQATRVEKHLSDYRDLMGPATPGKFPDLIAIPVCPQKGKYSVLPVKKNDFSSYKVRCSIHGDFIPGATK